MPARETSRIVVIGGRTWKIGKFDALTGSFITVKLLSKLSAIGVAVFAGKVSDPASIGMAIVEEIGSFGKAEFVNIQVESLLLIKEIVQIKDTSVESPVYLPEGKWGVGGVEDDALLVSTLVSHALLFNLTGFFDADALKDSKESFKGLIPFNASILTSTPSPQ